MLWEIWILNTPKVLFKVKSFGEGETGWFTFNPIKVKISVSGKIKKV